MSKILATVKENLSIENVGVSAVLLLLLGFGIAGVVIGIRNTDWTALITGFLFVILPMAAALDMGNPSGTDL